MTIEDQIKDEKLQYDINREAAKISALSSGKFDKYEYLTGEEILPSNQQQIIEQATFTYSPLGNAFEKQTKTIEDQGKKQIKAIQDKDFSKSIEKINFDDDDDLTILRQKELYNELTEEKKTEIKNLDNGVYRDKDKLIYKYKGNTSDVDFSEYYDAIDLINKINDRDVTLKQAINNQHDLKLKLKEVKKGHPNRKSITNLNVKKKLIIFIIQEKLLLIFLLNILKEFLKPNLDQNKKEQDLKY